MVRCISHLFNNNALRGGSFFRELKDLSKKELLFVVIEFPTVCGCIGSWKDFKVSFTKGLEWNVVCVCYSAEGWELVVKIGLKGEGNTSLKLRGHCKRKKVEDASRTRFDRLVCPTGSRIRHVNLEPSCLQRNGTES